jgi:tetraacyldisaccharide 4'-kinase
MVLSCGCEKLNQEAYRKLISGQSKGIAAPIARAILRLLSWGYAAIIGVRNLFYSKGLLKIHRANVPVISVGNITTGGTGKTPLVIWLYRQIIQNPKSKIQNCGILTRGYKTTDEPKILAQSCPDAKVIINPDRVAGAKEAINKHNAQILIMDDGFQHRRLARNLDIVTIDATCPFGYGKILPAGLLREPASALKRADAAVITRSDQIKKDELENLEIQLHQINPNILIAKAVHNPIGIQTTRGEQIAIDQLKGKKVFAFCGIGNPEAFFNTIKKTAAQLVGSKTYNDHHIYTDADINDIHEQSLYLGAQLVLTTQKDWTKISPMKLPIADIPFAYLVMEIKFIDGQDKLKQLIDMALTCKIPQIK